MIINREFDSTHIELSKTINIFFAEKLGLRSANWQINIDLTVPNETQFNDINIDGLEISKWVEFLLNNRILLASNGDPKIVAALSDIYPEQIRSVESYHPGYVANLLFAILRNVLPESVIINRVNIEDVG